MEEKPGNEHKENHEESDSDNFGERFSRFEKEMQNIAETELDPKTVSPTGHFKETPNFDLITEEDKKAMVEIWDKIKNGTITREELGRFSARASSEIKKIAGGAGMTSEESSRLTLSSMISLLNNRATLPIIRREMREKKQA